MVQRRRPGEPRRPGSRRRRRLQRRFARARSRSTSWSACSAKRRARRRPPAGALRRKAGRRQAARSDDDDEAESKVANKSIRVSVDTLENLMTMVSELVLTRNQLLDIVRRHDEFRIQGAVAAALQRHRRIAGRRHAHAHAADRQRLAEAAAHRARSFRRARQGHRARDARRRHRARPPGAGADQGPAHPYGAQLRRPRPGVARRAASPPASRRRAPSGSPPITRAATSSSASPTTAAASTSSASGDKALANGLATEAELDKMSEAADPEIHLRARLLHRRRRSPACPAAASAWTWCATTSIRSAARIDVQSVHGKGLSFTIKIPLTLAIVSALIVEVGRRALRHPAAFRGRAGPRARQVRASHRAHQGCRGAAAAQQAAAAGPPEQPAQARRRRRRSRKRASSS